MVVHLQRVVMLRIDKTQIIKWTAEGTVKGIFYLVHCDVRAYVSCQGYDGILQSAHFVNQGGTADVKE